MTTVTGPTASAWAGGANVVAVTPIPPSNEVTAMTAARVTCIPRGRVDRGDTCVT